MMAYPLLNRRQAKPLPLKSAMSLRSYKEITSAYGSLRGAAGDEAISTGVGTIAPRLLRFARNDSLREIDDFMPRGSTAWPMGLLR